MAFKIIRKGLTEIVFILDQSGSMSGLERDTIGGAIRHIKNIYKYAHEEGTLLNFSSLGDAVGVIRCNKKLPDTWKRKIELYCNESDS